MSEPTKAIPGHIVISPDDDRLRRTWPDPTSSEDARWKAFHCPDALTVEEIRQLAQAAETYAYVLSIPQRELLPSHAALRAHLNGRQSR